MKFRLLFLAIVAACSFLSTLQADDWPQWRGPDRNGVSKETGLLKEWPKDGPKVLWKAEELGGGYSTPAVVGDRLYLMSDRKGDEFALALNSKTGKQIWSIEIGKVGKNIGPQYPGSRSTPTVDGDRLYVLGSDGDLACLETDKGAVVWKKSLKKDFGGKPGNWAYSESVLIDGDVLVCTPGGETATMLALDKKDGNVIWKCAAPGKDAASYSSAIVIQVDKAKEYVQFVHGGVIGVDAKTGKFLWDYKKSRDQMANIMTPVFHDGSVFTSTGRNGSGLTRLKPEKDGVTAEEVYFTKDLQASIGGVVRVGDYIYGTGGKGLMCLEWKTGKVKWQDKSVGPGAVCYADGLLFVRGERGSVALVEANPEAYKEKGRFEQPNHGKISAWPHPVVSNGKLYLREADILLCYDVKGEKNK